MLIRGLYIENASETSDIRIRDGKFEEIKPHLDPLEGEETVDMKGRLALPPFIESHVHLDTCLTAGEPVWNQSGTLFEGIECWSKRKDKLTREDVRERVHRAVRMQASHGIQHVRTHVDVTDPDLTAMKAMIELREELRDVMNIQIVAFPQEGILSYPNGKELLEEAVKMGADAVGAIPHFEFTREYSVESINYAMGLAEKYDRLVDVHCDEIDDEASRGLETVAARAYEMGLSDRVTASHTTAMHSYNNAYVLRLMRLLKMSGINFVANPLVNTHLQGRIDTYPKRRGITRVKELTAEGINVSFGHDDIFDPWYPLGNGNLRDVVFMGLHVCQMMGYEEIMNSYRFISSNAAKTLHLGDSYGIKEGGSADFIILDAVNYYEALNVNAPVLRSYKNGRLIAEAQPGQSSVYFQAF
ncbi:cytosine deaminase [Clostridium sp. MCC353]|uniref:cytosine deaminase n=1 Tax=Clostridium sp. MCC353 TaxID=2592646 RepID=UPI001C022724|nr:cytosine deaminase [Clostridium sp. MCC353]MBT9776616.1 cytosine deaminase [Clostridium sp. MCC353]